MAPATAYQFLAMPVWRVPTWAKPTTTAASGNIGAGAELIGGEATLTTPAGSVTGGLSLSMSLSGGMGYAMRITTVTRILRQVFGSGVHLGRLHGEILVNATSKRALLALSLLLSSCGKEVGRVPFTSEASNSATTVLTAGRVAFWTDIDMQYAGNAELEYRIALVQGGIPVTTAVCHPLGHLSTKFSWVEVDIGSSHSRSGRGKMDCSATLGTAGPTTVAATLAFTVRPLRVTIGKADLVVKQ